MQSVKYDYMPNVRVGKTEGVFGLFATKAFRVGDVVGEYVGEVVTAEAMGGTGYRFGGDENDALGMDASRAGNEVRFIKDLAGCGAQNRAVNVRFARTVVRTLPAIMVVVIKPVKMGQEFLAGDDCELVAAEPVEMETETEMEEAAPVAAPTLASPDDDDGWATVVGKKALPASAPKAGAAAARQSGAEWPRQVKYLTEPRWNAKRLGALAMQSVRRDRMPNVRIGKITDAAHPVKGMFGLFATKAFRAGDVVGEYVGEVVTAETMGGTGYTAALGDENDALGMDAGRVGNESRFINDFRGCGVQNVRLSRSVVRALPAIMIVVIKPVKMGQEFLTNYGRGYWNE
jgi:hypothetical protein